MSLLGRWGAPCLAQTPGFPTLVVPSAKTMAISKYAQDTGRKLNTMSFLRGRRR